MDLSEDQLEFIINHVFLPPRLPGEEEEDLWGKEFGLLGLVQTFAQQFALQLAPESSSRWQPVLTMLQTWIDVIRLGDINKDLLDTKLKKLKVNGMSYESLYDTG